MKFYGSKWDRRFLDLALHFAGWSKDPDTQVGCVLVDKHTRAILSIGYNGPPYGVEDLPERLARPGKYTWCEHAERNAIYNAARLGVATEGTILYVASQPVHYFPCVECARAIVQAGIFRVVHQPPTPAPQWTESWAAAHSLLDEAGLIVDEIMP